MAYIQFVWGEELQRKALDVRMRDIPVAARRGAIYDCMGRDLAVSISVDSVYAFPAQIKDPEKTARALSEILLIPYENVHEKITRISSFEWIMRKVEPEQAKRVREARLSGIGLTQESKRCYPKGTLASHVLGISGIDNQGLEGIEVAYDSELRGTPGRIIVEMDALGRELPQATHRYDPPVEGHNLVLTLDEVIQFIAERELEKAIATTRAAGGTVTVMDPVSGEILALAARPNYDPNNFDKFPASNRRNPVINDTYPPGSTFKPITASAALEEGTTSLTDRFYCGGSVKVPGHTISCWRDDGHGSQSFVEAVQNSCNVAFVNMGLRLGAQRFSSYVDSFGFTGTTGIDLPGEATGITIKAAQIKTVDLACMAFGQTLTVTPIQLITAMSAIANGGMIVKPHLVKEIRTPDGRLVQSFGVTNVRRAISAKTAQEMRGSLQEVVERGTGRQARIAGYKIGGKTGTANKVVGGRIAEGKYISSFFGFAPADKPRLIALVTIDEPVGEYFGGVIAAPVFNAMVTDVLKYMGIPPAPGEQRDERPAAGGPAFVPDLANLTIEDAREAVASAGLSLKVHGGGSVVTSQEPSAGSTATVKSEVTVDTSDSASAGREGLVMVPSVIGKTMKEATAVLGGLGLNIEVVGSGFAVSQEPAPGARVPRNQIIKVKFSAPE